MEENKKTWIETIQEGWRKTPNSIKFWNGLVLLGLVIIGIISLEGLTIMLGLMSIAAFAVLISSISDGDYLEKHLWIWFTPLAWGMLILGLILFGFIKFYEGIIMKFNNWLDK